MAGCCNFKHLTAPSSSFHTQPRGASDVSPLHSRAVSSRGTPLLFPPLRLVHGLSLTDSLTGTTAPTHRHPLQRLHVLRTPPRSFLLLPPPLSSVASSIKDIAVKSVKASFFLFAPATPPTPPVQVTTHSQKSWHRTINARDGMRALIQQEQRSGRPRLAGVRVGRSPAAASPSRRRRRKSGSAAAVRPAPQPLGPSRSRTRTRREGKRRVLARSASEPALWLGDARVHAVPPHGLEHELDCPPSLPAPPLERPHTCFDVFAPEESSFGRSPSAASLTKLGSRDREVRSAN
jgi:hypothetical protein